MKVKEESEKFGLKLNIQKTKIMMALQSRVFSATSRLLSTCEGQLGILLEACERNTVPCQGELVAQGPFLPPTGILGFLSNFKSSQPSSNFEAFISP